MAALNGAASVALRGRIKRFSFFVAKNLFRRNLYWEGDAIVLRGCPVNTHELPHSWPRANPQDLHNPPQTWGSSWPWATALGRRSGPPSSCPRSPTRASSCSCGRASIGTCTTTRGVQVRRGVGLRGPRLQARVPRCSPDCPATPAPAELLCATCCEIDAGDFQDAERYGHRFKHTRREGVCCLALGKDLSAFPLDRDSADVDEIALYPGAVT